MNLEVERQVGHGPGGDRYYYQIVDRDNKSKLFGNYDSEKEANKVITLIKRGYELHRLEVEKKSKLTFGKVVDKVFECAIIIALWHIAIDVSNYLSKLSITYNG